MRTRRCRSTTPIGRRCCASACTPAAGSSAYGLRIGSRTEKVVHTVAQQIISSSLHRLLLEYVVALVIMTVFSIAVGWLLAGRALEPLRRITATARRVSGQNLGERIDLAGPDDELKELADTFDGMLGRLDSAFASQRHFVANASHELRTPLAIMRTEVDVALADPGVGGGELREMAEAIRETVDRCEQLIGSLLVLARSEAAEGREEAVDLAAIAGDCVTDLRARAQEAGIEIASHLDPAWIDGHPRPHRAAGGQPARQRHPAQRGRWAAHGDDRVPGRRRHPDRRQRRRADRSGGGRLADHAVSPPGSHGLGVRARPLDRPLGRRGPSRCGRAHRTA